MLRPESKVICKLEVSVLNQLDGTWPKTVVKLTKYSKSPHSDNDWEKGNQFILKTSSPRVVV